MYTETLVLTTCIATAFAQIPAAVITNNEPGTAYVGLLLGGPGPVIGQVQISAAREGVVVDMSLNGFNITDSSDYSYHIHQLPVPTDGNCTVTKAHFDNHGVTDDFVCDPANPEYCQLGDLSGKHGAIKLSGTSGTAVNLHYVDKFLSTTPGHPAFIGNLSIVIHKKSDKTRLRCGNLAKLGGTA